MVLLHILYLFIFLISSHAAIFTPEFQRELVSYIEDSMKCHHVPGMTLSVVKGKYVLHVFSFKYKSTLVISNFKGLSKILRDIRTSTYQICRRKKLIRLTTFNKYMCNWTLEVRDILKILWKR